jgi:indole-3-glycerol phosphate synthase
MRDTLAEIIEYKKAVVAERKILKSHTELEALTNTAPKPRHFANALLANHHSQQTALIAELKKASPSRGIIREDFDIAALAKAYEAGGATCLSVLTDEKYFSGHDDYILVAKSACSLPVLRKDFMIDPYQITESRALGADCILLIMAALSDAQAEELEDAALALGMDVLIESHNITELHRALRMKSPLIGINNRNLKTMEVSLDTSIGLCSYVPEGKMVICESGIHSHSDIVHMQKHHIYSFLVGESLMRQPDVEQATADLLGKSL